MESNKPQMAFTVAHMAAALPFYHSRRWLNFDALLIGTMLPDLPYFLDLVFLQRLFIGSVNTVARHSHEWSGLFSYCLPWGLLVFVVWSWGLKPAAIALAQPWLGVLKKDHQSPANMPNSHISHRHYFLKERFRFALKRGIYFWSQVVVGLLLGSVTHLLWDGTTHPNGFIAEQVNLLQQIVNIYWLGEMPVARLLQYLSSLLGLLMLGRFAYLTYYLPRSDYPLENSAYSNITPQKYSSSYNVLQPLILQKSHSLVIIILILASALSFSLQAAAKWHTLLVSDNYLFLAKITVGFMQGGGLSFVVYALLYHLYLQVRDALLLPNNSNF
jgi:hypothetical protein